MTFHDLSNFVFFFFSLISVLIQYLAKSFWQWHSSNTSVCAVWGNYNFFWSLRKLDCFFNNFHISLAFKYLDFNASFFESTANEFTEFFFIAAVSKEFFTDTWYFCWWFYDYCWWYCSSSTTWCPCSFKEIFRYTIKFLNWLHVFCFLFIRKNFVRKWATKILKKMLRKSPSSNAWAAIFKNAGF